MAPAKAHVTIEEQVLRRGIFRQVRLIKVATSAGGFTRAITLSRAGSYRFIARSPADRLTGFAQSAPVVVAVS